MKRNLLNIAVASCMAAFTMASCMKSDEVVTSPLCCITSFSVGNITSYVNLDYADGTSITTKRVLSGADIYFNIDQKNLTITNVDPLPMWCQLERVMPNFNCYGNVFVKADELYYPLVSGTDSIDMSRPVTLAVISSDGLYSKQYTLTVSRHSSESDTLVWSPVGVADLKLQGEHKALTVNATYKAADMTDSLVRRILVYSLDANGNPQVTSTTERSQATSWTAPAELTGSVVPIDINTITMHNGTVYALDQSGALYTTTELARGKDWTKVADTSLSGLLGSDGYRLYGYNHNAIMGSADMTEWTEAGSANLNMLPTSAIFCVCKPSKTNANMNVCTMGGLTASNGQNAVTWYKNSSTNTTIDSPWEYIQVTSDNAYGCPRLDGLSVFTYDDALFATGRKDNGDGTYSFAGFYRSDDNGIAWHKVSGSWPDPTGINANDGQFSAVIIGSTIYLVQEGGKVWRGNIK